MVAHRILHDLYAAPFLMVDPGASGTIRIDRDFAVVPVVTAAAEARTLAAPTKAGLVATVELDVDGGDLTLTIEDGYNEDADTSIVLPDAGNFVTFISIKVGASFYWRVLAQEGTNAALEDLAVDQLAVTSLSLGGTAITSTAAELNQLDGNILADMTPGAGIEPVTNSTCQHSVVKVGGLIRTTIVVDLAGLNGGGSANDIIGKQGTAGSHLGQITAAVNGTIFAGEMRCLEAPAGSNIDVDLNAASVATGAEDADVTALTGYAQLLDAGNWTVNTFKGLTAFPAANSYLYLSSGAPTDAAFTAGIFVIELWGK